MSNPPVRQHILVVDGDPALTAMLCDYVARYGFTAHAAATAEAMRSVLAHTPIDLCVLGLTRPTDSGLALALALRAESSVPIILLAAHSSPIDRVIGLELGADDYMDKPFEPRELVARIQTVLRRARPQAAALHPAHTGRIEFEGWQLDRAHRRLTSPAGAQLVLSNAEFQLLSALLQAPQRVVTRDELMTQLRGRATDGIERSIDLLVSRLRHKLAEGGDGSLIKTVRGRGYMAAGRPAPAR